MYRIKTLIIDGLHNVNHAKIALKDFCYFYGKNGAGKTTILNAIQLALLGYIPGSAKTNVAIMRHASKPEMYVSVTLDNGSGSEIKVTRTWKSKGASVSSETNIMPADIQIQDILGELALPVFDFNEFMNQSANALKDWFINILPSNSNDVDLRDKLDRAADKYGTSFNTAKISEIREAILNFDCENVLDSLKHGHTLVKDAMAATKNEITTLQNTLNTLVLYDDATGINSAAVQNALREKKQEQASYESAKQKLANIEAIETKLKAYDYLPAGSIQDDAELRERSTMNVANCAKLDELMSDRQEKIKAAAELNGQIAVLRNLIDKGNVCPFTNAACDSATAAISDAEKQIADLTARRVAIQKQVDAIALEEGRVSAEIETFSAFSRERRTAYEAKHLLEVELANAKQFVTLEEREAATKHTDATDYQAEIEALETQYAHAVANEKFDSLSNKLNADKTAATMDLEVLKAWDKLLGPNGLQTRVMSAPFINLAGTISTYLNKFFGRTDITAEFTLAEKANSFNFGMRYADSPYVAFETLSSGEQCLYTLSLLLALTEATDTQIPVILIDDLLDHLDESKASATFSTLYELSGIQILLAGVQPCSHGAANEFVEVIN